MVFPGSLGRSAEKFQFWLFFPVDRSSGGLPSKYRGGGCAERVACIARAFGTIAVNPRWRALS